MLISYKVGFLNQWEILNESIKKQRSLYGLNTLEIRNYEEFDWDGRKGNGEKESNLGFTLENTNKTYLWIGH